MTATGETTKLCIDLCSGLGGFSQAFVDAGWEVITVDVEPKFKPTICADILALTAQEIETRTLLGSFAQYGLIVVVASPPCERFSLAAHGRGEVEFPGRGIRKALEMVGACLELIREIKPDYWLLENPKARLRWFIGKPHISVSYQDFGSPKLKPTDLWGNVPLPLLMESRAKKIDWMKVPGYAELPTEKRRAFRHKVWSHSQENRAKRAEVPIGLSKAILKAVEPSPQRREEPSK